MPLKQPIVRASVAVSLVLGVACVKQRPTPPIVLGHDIDSLISAVCTNAVACQNVDPSTFLATADACVPWLWLAPVGSMDVWSTAPADATSFDSYESLELSISAGQVTVDTTKLAACATAAQALPCWVLRPTLSDLPACVGLFTGNLAAGASCVTSTACGPGLFCATTTVACGGTCTALPAGNACQVDSDCTPGLICSNSTCGTPPAPPGAAGETCGSHGLCQSGLYCNGQNICADAFTLGQDCTKTSDCPPSPSVVCASGTCQIGGITDFSADWQCPAGESCVPDDDMTAAFGSCTTYKSAGEPCTNTFECGALNSFLICDASSQVCVARPATGPCPANTPLACDWRVSYCDAQATGAPTCSPLLGAGAACVSNDACGYRIGKGYCGGAGTCEAPQDATVCTPG